MDHRLNLQLVKDYDINTSVFITTLQELYATNVAQSSVTLNGNTYLCVKQLRDFFPYYSFKSIRALINKCVRNGLLDKGNFGKTAFEKTLWITLSPYAKEYFA